MQDAIKEAYLLGFEEEASELAKEAGPITEGVGGALWFPVPSAIGGAIGAAGPGGYESKEKMQQATSGVGEGVLNVVAPGYAGYRLGRRFSTNENNFDSNNESSSNSESSSEPESSDTSKESSADVEALKQLLTKEADYSSEAGGAMAGAMIPFYNFIHGPASAVGGAAGLMTDAPTDKELEEQSKHTASNFLPGVGMYRLTNRMQNQVGNYDTSEEGNSSSNEEQE